MWINRQTKKTKNSSKTKKTKLLRECLVLTQKMFFLVFPRFFSLTVFFDRVPEMENQKEMFFWMDMMYQDLKKQKTFLFFSTFWFENCIETCQKQFLSLVFKHSPKSFFGWIFGLFFLVLLEFFFSFPGFVCFSRCGPSCSSMVVRPRPKSHYWLHERVEADDRVKQTRGWSGQTKVLNQSLPLNNNALDIIITTQIYWNIQVQKPAPHERPFCELLNFSGCALYAKTAW